MVCYGEVKTFVIQSYFSCISKGFCLLTAEFHVEGHIMITFIRSCYLISDFDMREVMPFYFNDTFMSFRSHCFCSF